MALPSTSMLSMNFAILQFQNLLPLYQSNRMILSADDELDSPECLQGARAWCSHRCQWYQNCWCLEQWQARWNRASRWLCPHMYLVSSCSFLSLRPLSSRLEEELVEMMVSGTEAMKMSENCHLKIDSAMATWHRSILVVQQSSHLCSLEFGTSWHILVLFAMKPSWFSIARRVFIASRKPEVQPGTYGSCWRLKGTTQSFYMFLLTLNL